MSALATYSSGLAEVTAPIWGPDWLLDLQAAARQTFAEIGVPTPKQEEWKYTPLRDVADRDWSGPTPGPAVFDFELPFVIPGSHRIVLVNGYFDRNLSDFSAVAGLKILSMRSAVQDHPESVRAHLGQLAQLQNYSFAALNSAMFQDGAYIFVEAGAKIERPIEILHVSSGEGAIVASRILVIAEEGAEVKITERFISDGQSQNLVIPVAECFVGPSARVEHVRIQDEAETSYHIGLWEVRQEKESFCAAYNMAFGGAIARLDQGMDLVGEHAEARLDGVAAARGSQLIDNHTRLDHRVPNCNSFEVYKQVIDGEATVVFNGKIYVHPQAQKTDAKQTNQALLLSPNATINSKPQLEIFADDVKCTHGATVGQLEDLPLFYLRSRGITKAEAEAVLVYAFAAEVVELISMEEVKIDIEAKLMAKLNVTLD